ncbi:MAG: hypothetical protein LBU32_01690 [Clostridiales bacterium]|nr:hypothetical protein [Clostridiales bacterium]
MNASDATSVGRETALYLRNLIDGAENRRRTEILNRMCQKVGRQTGAAKIAQSSPISPEKLKHRARKPGRQMVEICVKPRNKRRDGDGICSGNCENAIETYRLRQEDVAGAR